ncbi:unnamed protein product, partial [Rotaria sp. Silwood1]
MMQHHCLVSFPSEGIHRIWSQHLIRSKGRFGFEAKFGKQCFECRIENEGIIEECEKARESLEKTIATRINWKVLAITIFLFQKPNLSPPIEPLIVNKVNLMTLRGKTASRFLLSAAHIVLTDAEFTSGYLPDFHGNEENHVPIPQESVDLLHRVVRQRFGFKEEDIGRIWGSIRKSLVQKITDNRKSEKRKSQKHEQNKQPQQHPISLSEDNHDLVSVATNNQAE